jgi:glutamyl-Q tRNA(Asp) synthetase
MYIGRFAPSPSGPMHFGSLITAVASYLDAKHQHGIWKLRIEDLDQPRTIKGSDKTILDTLHQHGFHWDDEVIYQSHRLDIYTSLSYRNYMKKKLPIIANVAEKKLPTQP